MTEKLLAHMNFIIPHRVKERAAVFAVQCIDRIAKRQSSSELFQVMPDYCQMNGVEFYDHPPELHTLPLYLQEMRESALTIHPIGHIRSTLTDRKDAPRQPDENAPDAWLELDPKYNEALLGMNPGDKIIVLTWLHESRREQLQVHPRRIANAPLTGVFATRSPDRPNPIGLHETTVLEITEKGIHVDALECINGTPILDIKPVLCP